MQKQSLKSFVKNLQPPQPLQPGHYGKFCTTINQCRDDWVQLFMFAFIRTMMTEEPKKRSDWTPLPTKSWMAKRQKLQSGNWIQGWSTYPISLAAIKPSCISILVTSHQGSVEQPWKLDPWIHLRWQAWCRFIAVTSWWKPMVYDSAAMHTQTYWKRNISSV